MLVKYYYLRNIKNEPRVTKCIVMNKNGNVAIGSAICSPSDFPNKKIGRKIALERACHTLEVGKNILPISRPKAIHVLFNVKADNTDWYSICFDNMNFKGLYIEDRDNLNPLEKKLLKSYRV